LVVVGREVEHEKRPVVVAGDLNDVAWSQTTQLFLRLGRMLDPRAGRGLYSSYNANSRIARWPLDHVFHNDCFTVGRIKIMPHVGSDHFPILVELFYEPEKRHVQEPPPKKPDDSEEANEKIERAEEAEEARVRSHAT
jgi:endonuclease/exonuclease/phosphatase (EEP) superfamily protein YafD